MPHPDKLFVRRRSIGAVAAAITACCLWTAGDITLAHEHLHTHQNLARASFRLLDSPFFETGRFGLLTAQDIENEIAQGVIDEDTCLTLDDTDGQHNWGGKASWNSHFFEAKTGGRLGVEIALGGFGDCEFAAWGTHTSAAERARMLYTMARNDYRAGRYRSSFRILGRVMHLLQDMTSPAHVHDDPHGELPMVNDCGGDTDDFERWGYCEGLAPGGSHSRVCEYFYDPSHTNHPDVPPRVVFQGCIAPPPAPTECVADFDGDGEDESYGVPPAGFHCRLWAALHILYDGRPAGSRGSNTLVPIGASENAGFAFVRRVANVTYDFTTFTVHLEDGTISDDPQPDSELKSMLRGSTVDDCNNEPDLDYGLCEGIRSNVWTISGSHQHIGDTEAAQGSVEKQWLDTLEEWWIMPTFYFKSSDETQIDGYAYIENRGGFIPLRYGCSAADNEANSGLCSEVGVGPRSKAMYQRLYGTVWNDEDPFDPEPPGKPMLRIWGDILYPTAVAYGAGLIQAFIDDVTVPPVADAGGPYHGEACTPVNFDASASSDASTTSPNGSIASYAWDVTDDGTFERTAAAAQYPYAYAAPFEGRARVRVTDNEGFTGDDTAAVVITPDVTAPLITNISATPDRLAPADNRMAPVTVDVLVAGACNDAVCRITGVTSSEPDNGAGPDWAMVAPLTVQLRAERSGATDRIYTIALACSDAAGNASTGEVTVIVAPESRPPSREMDFDRNGWVDLLWHHRTNGRIATWLNTGVTGMAGKHFEGRPQESDTGWKVVGSGDIDQDGYPDLVWQHAADGRLRYWGTNNLRITIERSFSPGIVRDTGWKVRAIADFNRDGKPDLVWQHETDGRIAVWFMDGAAALSVGFLGPGQVADLAWQIVGTGDFNRDGWPDLAWQHQRDGRIAVWQMQGTAVLVAGLISPGWVFDLDWKIRGAGDINGDDLPDLLWQHRASGNVATWLMNGTTMTSGLVIGRVPDTDWHVVGPR